MGMSLIAAQWNGRFQLPRFCNCVNMYGSERKSEPAGNTGMACRLSFVVMSQTQLHPCVLAVSKTASIRALPMPQCSCKLCRTKDLAPPVFYGVQNVAEQGVTVCGHKSFGAGSIVDNAAGYNERAAPFFLNVPVDRRTKSVIDRQNQNNHLSVWGISSVHMGLPQKEMDWC